MFRQRSSIVAVFGAFVICAPAVAATPSYYEKLPATINSEAYYKMANQLVGANTSEFILFKDGQLVASYSKNNEFTLPRSVQSISKTMSALTILLSVSEKDIAKTLAQKITNFKAPYPYQEFHKNIKLSDLLSHVSGLQEDDTFWQGTDNFLKKSLELPQVTKPGETFFYSNAGSLILAPAIDALAKKNALCQKVTTDPVVCLLNEKLLKALDIKDFTFQRDRYGNLVSSGGVSTSAMSLAKLGLLFLNRGVYQGKQIIPASVIDKITQYKMTATPCYGLMIWKLNSVCGDYAASGLPSVTPDLTRTEGYYMDGFGGQYVVVIPSKKIVAVRTQANLVFSSLQESSLMSYPTFPDLISRL